jgi:L-serine deaminase
MAIVKQDRNYYFFIINRKMIADDVNQIIIDCELNINLFLSKRKKNSEKLYLVKHEINFHSN